MDSPSIIEMYEVVVHPIMTFFFFVVAVLGIVVAIQLSKENYELKIKLGKIDRQSNIDWLLWIVNLSGLMLIYVGGYLKVICLYYGFYKTKFQSIVLKKIKKFVYAKI